ncbi:MAG: flagellar protein FlgN [Spirochaetaceae bacterium]|jgi:hypothetical protein|nr:flagellar protein FlgN [Spirochaetaceae bacterium]
MENMQVFSLILAKEIEILEKIPPLQGMIRSAVIKREWTDYEALTETVNELGESFETLDAEREAVFKAVGGDKEPESFYAWAATLPSREREEIAALYRRLKLAALHIRIANDTLMEYLREVKSAVAGVLERAYPDRRGKMYSRKGTEREADMRSVMVNHTF